MKLEIRKCDYCGIEEPEPTIGWYRLSYESPHATEETDTEPKDLHSVSCILGYAQGLFEKEVQREEAS